MIIKAALFDMDGTIIKSLDCWDDIIISFIGKENIKRFRDEKRQATTRGLGNTGDIFRSVFGLQITDDQVRKQYAEKAHEIFTASSIDFIKDFHEFHGHLMSRQISTSLATNAPNYALDVLRNKLNLSSFFGQHIYNSCTVNTFKPNPAVFLHALEKLNIAPEHAIIFEDSYEGVAAAKRAGIRCIGINSGDNLDELDGADFIVQDYTGLTIETIIKKLT